MPHTDLTVYGAVWCEDCKRAKKFLGEQRVHYNWVDVEQSAEGLALVERVNNGKRIIPTIVFEDKSLLVEPSNAELAAKLGLQTRAKMNYYDVISVGGGPTGLTTALYAAREGLDVLVIEKSGLGGQAGVTERLDNFPGFPDGIAGAEFADRLAAQARRFNVEILQAQEVTQLRRRRRVALRRHLRRERVRCAGRADRHRLHLSPPRRAGRGRAHRRGHPLLRHV